MCIRLAAWTTLGVGGEAKSLKVARSGEELADFSHEGIVIGRGSNLLASDDGYDGAVVVNRFERVDADGCTLVAGSGTRLAVLAGVALENGLTGFEWAHGIPGSVGGAVVMNAGAFGGEISDALIYVDVLCGGEVKRLYKSELGFGYRTSNVRGVVIRAAFELRGGDKRSISSRMTEFARRRRATQPSGKTAGSVFKNQPGVSVGKLLDEAGLKGLRRGGAEISEKHANMIVNIGGATANDIVSLISVMRGELIARGVAAEEEIIYIGNFG